MVRAKSHCPACEASLIINHPRGEIFNCPLCEVLLEVVELYDGVFAFKIGDSNRSESSIILEYSGIIASVVDLFNDYKTARQKAVYYEEHRELDDTMEEWMSTKDRIRFALMHNEQSGNLDIEQIIKLRKLDKLAEKIKQIEPGNDYYNIKFISIVAEMTHCFTNTLDFDISSLLEL